MNFVNYPKTPCRGSMNGWACSETPVLPLKNIFHRTSPVASCFWQFQVSSLQLCWKKRLRQRWLSVNFAKDFKNIFWQNATGWLLLVFICEFWEVFQITSSIEHLWETAYFIYKLPNLKHHIQSKSISQVLFKHFIQEEEVAARMRSCTKNLWTLSVKKLIYNEVARCRPAN